MLVKARKNQYNLYVATHQKDSVNNIKNFITNYDVHPGSEIILQESKNKKTFYIVDNLVYTTTQPYNKKIIDAYIDIDFDAFIDKNSERYFYKVCIGNKFVNVYAKVDLPVNTYVLTGLGEGKIISNGNFIPETNIMVAYNEFKEIIYQDRIASESLKKNMKFDMSYEINLANINYADLIICDNYPFDKEDFYSINYLINCFRLDKSPYILENLLRYFEDVGDYEKIKYFKKFEKKNL